MNLDHIHFTFDPVLPWWILGAMGAVGLAAAIMAGWLGQRGQIFRLLFLALILLALAHPQWVAEQSDALKDVAAIVVDRSQSQSLADRPGQTEKALAAAKASLDADPHLETRIIEAGSSGDDGTNLFAPMARALSDVPNDRLAAIIMITDGQVHDVPADPAKAGVTAPLHVLLTGQKHETDRRLIVEEAPKFAILNEPNEIAVKVEDESMPAGTELPLTLSIDGARIAGETVRVGETSHIQIQLGHAGPNVVEMDVPPGDNYLTRDNKRAVAVIQGIRNRLRVLLVSGEPYPGERTWRNLLKADPAVDLVHFTILRPPEKQDGTPFNELALIAFPTRELFVDKLNQFDLIIFDRHHWRGILPAAYFDNIARYVENGGSVLVAVGNAYATSMSLFRTPLAAVLPAEPTGEIVDTPFRPQLTEAGRRHPVTADLPGSGRAGSEPSWGHWFRLIEARPLLGETVMEGPGGRPLLQLARVEKGRVAQLMSDQVWLWARGYDGGGPQAELLRRIAHWLMKEPELEEESLHAETRGQRIEIDRRSLGEQVAPVTVTGPSGLETTIPLNADSAGHWRGEYDAPSQGLYHLQDGPLSALAVVGPANSREMQDVRATADKLAPAASATGGGVFWLADGMPEFRRVSPGRSTHGANWAGLIANGKVNVTAVTSAPLIPASLLLALALGGLFLAWWREGR